jgi:hypothetical protein
MLKKKLCSLVILLTVKGRREDGDLEERWVHDFPLIDSGM